MGHVRKSIASFFSLPPSLHTQAKLLPVEGGDEEEDLQVEGGVGPEVEPVARVVVGVGDESGGGGREGGEGREGA
jgi:hypothetical protein